MFMNVFKDENQKRRTFRWTTVPVVLALLAVAAAIASLLFWSAVRTDSLEFQRQGRLINEVMSNQAKKWSNAVEVHTTWDKAAAELHKPVLDLEWIDGTLGIWRFTASGIEETYILDDRNVPLYSMADGRRVSRASFDSARETFAPMVRDLRLKMVHPEKHLIDKDITPAVIDYAVVHGHPAIVVVKPITPVGTTVPGQMGIVRADVPNQTPGEEYIYISLRRMDNKSLLLARLRDEHLFEPVRFSWTPDIRSGEGAHPIRSPRSGRIIGYYLWKPFKPGSAVLRDMILPLLIGLSIVGIITWFLIRRIRRSAAELQASEAQAKHLAFHDVLTGLPNRALFNDRLERALAANRRDPNETVALLYLDVDRFKAVNDTFGHPAGDELIREIGARLTASTRETDTVARLGGDEFAIIQTHKGSPDSLHKLCKRIIASVNEPFDLIGSQVRVGMSVGVARAEIDGVDRTELSRKADIALYHAKGSGRGRYSIFAEEMDETIQFRQSVECDLHIALDRGDQLQVHYQPQYDAASKTIAGVEALVRWYHPTRGMLSPVTFIPIAEECGLIEPLGEWVLEQACIAGRHWPMGTVSVNVSPVQLRNKLFSRRVLEIAAAQGFPLERLELEITETAFTDRAAQCELSLQALREKGVRIALDDFGTGYSSFSHLRDFQVDRIKIDRSFITEIDGSQNESAIIQAIIGLARAFGLKITAEGVETIEQSNFLCSAGCDELQGFLMSRPLPMREIDRLLGVNPHLRRPPPRQALAA